MSHPADRLNQSDRPDEWAGPTEPGHAADGESSDLRPPRPPLPAGFGLALAPDVRRPRAEVLIGGHPVRVLRLRPAGAATVDAWAAGRPIDKGTGRQRLAARLLDAAIAHPRPDRAAGPSVADITVVIPVRDDPAGLSRTIAALTRPVASLGPSNSPEPREPVDRPVADDWPAIIVVDDGSILTVSPARVGAAHLGDALTIRRRSRPGGPAAARNDGWEAATSPIVVFLDAGCVPEPGWLDPLLAHFADPAVGAVAARVVSQADAGTRPWIAAYERLRSPLDLGPDEALVRPGSPVSYVPTAALAVRVRALTDAGGFDESFRFGEDVDLVWRLSALGWRVRYEPAAVVAHAPRPDIRSWLRQRFDYGCSAAPLADRHGAAVAPMAGSASSALAWGLIALGRPILGAAVAAATAGALARRTSDDRPTAVVLVRLALEGHARAGGTAAFAVRRAWLGPLAATAWALTRIAGRTARTPTARTPASHVLVSRIGAKAGRSLGRAIVAACVIPPAAEWVTRRPPLGPLQWVGARLADDLAYQAGVWTGTVRRRSLRALLPDW